MDWNLFWVAMGTIGQWLGVIATFLAVVVSLRLAQSATRISLKVTAEQLGADQGYGVRFTVVNLSQQVVTLIEVGVVVPRKGELRLRGLYTSKPTVELKPMEPDDMFVSAADLARWLQEQGVVVAVILPVFAEDWHHQRHWGTLTFDPGKHAAADGPVQ